MVAVRFLTAVERSFNELLENPLIGTPRHFTAGALRGVRSWLVSGFETFVIFYRPSPKGIDVIRLIHSARDLQRIFGQES
jgi:toxin ParE1/3/4